MDPRELAEQIKDELELFAHDSCVDELRNADFDWGHGDADFFVRTERDGTFLVTVSKVAE